MSETPNQPQGKRNLIEVLKNLAKLYLENIRYTSAEKITILFSSIAMFSVLLILGLIALIFIFIGLANMFDTYIDAFWSYFIIAGIVFLLMGCVIMFKDKLIFNPIARFISKLFLDPPKDK